MAKIYQKRHLWTHKGQNGKLLVVAGSNKHTGSAIFNAVAALRSGVDLVTVASPQRPADIAANFAPDLITAPLKGDFLTREHLPLILELANVSNAVVLGSGLGREKETYAAVAEIINKVHRPLVVDADAIRALEEVKQNLNRENRQVIITPHADEFISLTGEKVLPEVEDRKEKVKKWAGILKAVILLKGHVDVISDGFETVLNDTNSIYMTKGGFGDTLAGICGSLLAQKIPALQAAEYAAYINGKAGELAAKKFAQGVIASDIFEEIPNVVRKL